ncbi:hypothetical protein GCM10028817_38940 [Spirosoma pomorum]
MALPVPTPYTPYLQSGKPGNTETAVNQVLPPPVNHGLQPVYHGLPTQDEVLPEAGKPGITDDGIPQNQVYQAVQAPAVNQVLPEENPGKPGITAPDQSAADGAQTVKEEVVGKTFKLPVSVMQSLERAVLNINAALPPHEHITTHAYGIEVLTHHEAYLNAASQQNSYQALYQNEVAKNQQLQQELYQEQQKNAALLARINQPVIASNQPITPQFIPAQDKPTMPAVAAPTPVPDAADIEKYNRLVEQYNQLMQHYSQSNKVLTSYQVFFPELNKIIKELCDEAQRLSWTNSAYFLWFFQVRVQDVLPN